MQLTPVPYVSKTNGHAEIGFLAKNVEKLDKCLSTYDRGEPAGVQYDHTVACSRKRYRSSKRRWRSCSSRSRNSKQAD
jgi:hypothetical protein